jgi:hypothetical protein
MGTVIKGQRRVCGSLREKSRNENRLTGSLACQVEPARFHFRVTAARMKGFRDVFAFCDGRPEPWLSPTRHAVCGKGSQLRNAGKLVAAC